jgi:hypothetical protein
MQKELLLFVVFLSLPTLCATVSAQQLPKSGSISFHTGWKGAGEALTVADKHVQGHGSVVGVTFNDKGEGPLHLGAGECFYTWRIREFSG